MWRTRISFFMPVYPGAPSPFVGGPKLTPQVQRVSCRALGEGNAEEVSARLAGIGTTTFVRWMQRGAKAAEALARAEIGEMGPEWREPDWRAAMALLERRLPERWGRRAHVEVAGEVGGEGDVPAGRIVVEDPIARELARRLRDRILDAGEGDGS